MTQQKKWTGKTGGGNFGQKFLFLILKSIKVSLLYPILFFVVPFYCLFRAKDFRSIYRYFREIHHYSKWKSFRKTIRNHMVFGRVVLDKFAVLAGNSGQFSINVDNVSQFETLLSQPEGFILMAAHIGNFEIIGHCLRQNRKQVHCLIYGGEGATLQNKRDESLRKNNIHLIPIQEDMSHIFEIKKALDNGGIIIILCDRVWGSNKQIPLNFMGKQASLPLGPFIMAAQLEVQAIFVAVMKEKSLHYSGYLTQLNLPENPLNIREKSKYLANEYSKAMDKILRQYPEQWFNYYDFWHVNN